MLPFPDYLLTPKVKPLNYLSVTDPELAALSPHKDMISELHDFPARRSPNVVDLGRYTAFIEKANSKVCISGFGNFVG